MRAEAFTHSAFDALRGPLERFGDVTMPDVAMIDERLGPLAGVRFEVQRKVRRPRGPRRTDALYDGRIVVHGCVPTRRGSLHDLMNALAWAAFPRAKRALHARQYAALRARLGDAAAQLPAARTREQDALSLLDEGGLLLLALRDGDGARRALAEGDFGALRARVDAGALVPLVFGHAITEHIALGRVPAPRASTLVLEPAATTTGAVSPRDAVSLADAALAVHFETPGSCMQPSPWPAVPIDALLPPGP